MRQSGKNYEEGGGRVLKGIWSRVYIIYNKNSSSLELLVIMFYYWPPLI